MQLEEYKRRAGRGERIAAGSDAHLFMHGAGLVMISVEFARYFIERHA